VHTNDVSHTEQWRALCSATVRLLRVATSTWTRGASCSPHQSTTPTTSHRWQHCNQTHTINSTTPPHHHFWLSHAHTHTHTQHDLHV